MPRPSKKTIEFNPLDEAKKKSSAGVRSGKTISVSSPKQNRKPTAEFYSRKSGEDNMTQEIPAETILDNELNANDEATKSVNALDYRNLLAKQCVKNWSQWATVAGFIPLELIDTAAISGVQLKLTYDLCKIYDVPFKKESALAVIGALVGGSITTMASQRLGASLVNKIPYVGGILGSVTQPAIAYGSTYALGLVFISHFEKDGTLHNFNLESAKTLFDEQVQKAKVSSSKYYVEAKTITGQQISKLKTALKRKLFPSDSQVIDMEVSP